MDALLAVRRPAGRPGHRQPQLPAHVEQLEQIAAAKVTVPILCEKPLYTDAPKMPPRRAGACKASYGAPIWVAMEYRYMPPDRPP